MASRAIAARNKLGTVCRYPHDESQVSDARRELAAAKICDYVEKVVAGAPPLTQAQIEDVAGLLRAGASA
jgi:hypothetical protein